MVLKSLSVSMAVFVLTACTLSSCFVDDEILSEEEDEFYDGEEIVLGERLQNPYSVVNMKLALESLKINSSDSIVRSHTEIRTTHLYVRFLPRDLQQLDALRNDTSLLLIDHPVDYEVLKDGDYFNDPTVPDDQPMPLYAAVPVEHAAPGGIAFEILDQLFLPDNRSLEDGARANDGNFYSLLEDEALRISGNLEGDNIPGQTAGGRLPAKWTPTGRVTVWDNRLNKYIPLAGVKVEARRWFDVKQAITDANGYFRMSGTFRRAVRYQVVFERSKFDIRNGTFGQAKLRGPHTRGDWNAVIERDGMAFHFAHVFRAAMRYYYGEIGGLARPSFRLKYSVFNKKGNHSARNIGNWSAFGINPNIFIYRFNPTDGSENDSDEMFSNTCHETAHTTHMQAMRGGAIQFLQVSEAIRESWAIGVEWFITQKEYKEHGITNYADPNYRVSASFPTLYGFQYWNKRRNETLTSLFIDIVDRNNQEGQSFGTFRTGTVRDPISGYTFAAIESNILRNVYGLGSLSEQLKANRPVEITDQQIDIFIQNF